MTKKKNCKTIINKTIKKKLRIEQHELNVPRKGRYFIRCLHAVFLEVHFKKSLMQSAGITLPQCCARPKPPMTYSSICLYCGLFVQCIPDITINRIVMINVTTVCRHNQIRLAYTCLMNIFHVIIKCFAVLCHCDPLAFLNSDKRRKTVYVQSFS